MNPSASTGVYERCLAVAEGFPLPKTQASLTPVTLERGVKIACELLDNTSTLRNKEEHATLLVMEAIRPKKDLYSLKKVPEQGARGIIVASSISNNVITKFIGGLLDASRIPVFGSIMTEPNGYVTAGASADELLTANKPGHQTAVMTLGECLLGGSAIALINSWMGLRGGCLTVCCGDSSYRFGTSLIEDPPLLDQDEHPFNAKEENPASSREDTGLLDGHDDDETEPGRSTAPGGNVFASMLNRGATALNKLASAKGGFGTLPDLADMTGDGNRDAKDKKPDPPAAGPGFGLPQGKRRQTAGDLIFGENNYLVFNLLTTDTVGSDLNVGAVSKPIFTTCVSEYLYAAGFGTCAAERPLSEQSKVSYAATHVFGGLLSVGGGVLVENHGLLCSGATAHSQATAYGTFCCLRYTDHRLVQKKGTISRASHMRSLNRILPQKLEKISLRSIPAGFKETATHGAKNDAYCVRRWITYPTRRHC